MSLTDDQEREVTRIAKLEVREYFDHYLLEVFPTQVRAIKAHTHTSIEAHDGDRKAHGSAEKKINRLIYGWAGIIALIGVLVALKEIFH